MPVLVACEYSGRVRDALLRKGVDAISCDILPTEIPGPHIEADLGSVLDQDWDAIIAFPPCTYLCSSGLHWNKRRPERAQKTKAALRFVRRITASAPVWAIENPVGKIGTAIRPASQYIQPWQFGHPESKKTGLWLQGLPLLEPTNVLPLPESGRWDNQTPTGQNKLGPSKDRAKKRSLTYWGIAEAMAEQWAPYL